MLCDVYNVKEQVISHVIVLHSNMEFLLLDELFDIIIIVPLTLCFKNPISGANHDQFHMLKSEITFNINVIKNVYNDQNTLMIF